MIKISVVLVTLRDICLLKVEDSVLDLSSVATSKISYDV